MCVPNVNEVPRAHYRSSFGHVVSNHQIVVNLLQYLEVFKALVPLATNVDICTRSVNDPKGNLLNLALGYLMD
jgi:hypothetical protein